MIATQNNNWIKFNIHDLVYFRVEAGAPTAAIFQDIFAPFLSDSEPEHFDLTIRGDLEPLIDGAFGEAHGETEFHYNNQGLHMHATDVQIFMENDGFRLNGSRELLVMALPLIDRLMVTKQAAMLHCLTVAYRDHGLLIPAWGGTGKTSTMAKLTKMDGFAFMGDDWAFLTEGGALLGYAKPMSIKPYHRDLYPHLFKKTLQAPGAAIAGQANPQPHDPAASFCYPVSPACFHDPPLVAGTFDGHTLPGFSTCKFLHPRPLAAALFVERFVTDSSEPVFEEQSKEWMIARLIGNFHSEMTKFSRVVMTTLGASGLVPIEKAFIEKRAVLEKGLQDKPCYLLRVPQALPPDAASDIIVNAIQKLIHIARIE